MCRVVRLPTYRRLPDGKRTSYVAVYGVAIGYLLLAAILIYRVRGVR
jgi:hypothetical protein